MSTISASRWSYNYWESLYNTPLEPTFDLESSLSAIFDGEPSYVSDSYVSGWLYQGGSFQMWGSGFEYATRPEDVTVTRITSNPPSGNFELTGNLQGGGYADVQGQITYIQFSGGGNTFTARGDMRISYYGDTYAFNTTEEISLSNGAYIRSKTNASGNYTQHYVQYQGNSITIDGSWAYGPVYELSDLFQGSDTLNGTTGNDFLNGYAGNDRLMGCNGSDTAIFNGPRADYTVQKFSNGEIQVSDRLTFRDGVDTLISVERLMFSDQDIAFDINGATSAGGIYRLYKATFDRTPDLEGLGYWIDRADNGRSAVSMAEDFVWSTEFQNLYGVKTQDQYLTGSDIEALVTGFYRNVFDREPDQGGLNFYVGVISNQERTVGRVLAEICDSPENYAATIGLIQNGIQYDVWIG